MDEAFDVALIKQVKKYTMLYNVNAKGYTNVEKKSRIWNAIGKRLNTSGQACFKRWTSMRNCYRQNVDRARKRGRSPTWVYFKLMNFLDNFPNPKQIKIFASQSSKNDNDELSNDTEMADNMDEEELCWRLIEEVKKREELYNKKSPIYYDTAKRGDTWKEIGRILDRSESACKDKWRSFRDIYIKLRKRSMLNGNSRNRRWKYYDKMKFLDNYIILNTPKTSINLSDGLNICKETGNSILNSSIEYDSQSENNSCDVPNDAQKKREFTKEDNFQLIQFVKSEPILYSRKWANKSNIFRRRKWEEIARELCTNVQTCKERWRCLRDQYIKLKKKQHQNEGDFSWLYFNQLTFLNEHIGGKAADTVSSNNIIYNSEESSEVQEMSATKGKTLENNIQLTTEIVTEFANDVKPEESLHDVYDHDERYSLSSNELITFEADALMDIPAEQDWSNDIEYKYERVENECFKADLEQEFVKGEIDENFDDEPILYLQNNGQDDTLSSDSSLSLSHSNKLTDKTNLLASLKEFVQDNKQQCPTCQEHTKIQKDSTTLLFESLAVSIKNSQLSECEMLELQADIHSYVIQRLVDFNNSRKAAP